MSATETVCPRTPEAILHALERKPEWLESFQQEWMAAAADFSADALAAVLDKWHPAAIACATPGHLDEVEDMVRRLDAGDDADLVFYDEDGRAWSAENECRPDRDRR